MNYEILKFEKENCTPCKLVDGWLERNNISAIHVNAFDAPDIAHVHHVKSCPTIIVLEVTGNKEEAKEIFRTVGYKTDELEQLKQYQTKKEV